MKLQNSILPKVVTIQYVEDDIARIALIKNIQEITEDENKLYEYDEIVFNAIYRDTLEESIKNNIEVWWEFAETQKKEEKLKKDIANKFYNFKEGDIINSNLSLESSMMLVTNLMLEVDELKKKIITLESKVK